MSSNEKEIIAITATQIDDIQACKRKYRYHVEENYVLAETPEFFIKGEFVHFLLERYYTGVKEKRELVPLLKEIVDEAERVSIDMPISEDNVKDCLRVFKAYVTKHHGEQWEPVFIERPFTKKLYEDDKRLIVVQGRLDLVVDVSNDRIIVDHKTGQRDNELSSMSNQNLAYCWATGERKVVINKLFFQKEPKFKRYTFGYDDERVTEWENTVIADVLQYYIFHFLNQGSCGSPLLYNVFNL